MHYSSYQYLLGAGAVLCFKVMFLSFGVNWNETTKKIDVTIRPVNTDLKVIPKMKITMHFIRFIFKVVF